MVIEYTIEGSINAIVYVVHQGPICGPLVFLCRKVEII